MVKKFLVLYAVLTVLSAAVFAEPVADVNTRLPSPSSTSLNRDDLSYAFGILLGEQFAEVESGLSFNYADLAKGFQDGVEGTGNMSVDDAAELVNAAFQAALAEKSSENQAAEIAFLAENTQQEGVITTASGLQYKVLKAGTGPKPTINDSVQVHYTGSLTDGTMFDNTFERDEPIEFALNEVIDGWAEGLQLMNVGGEYRLFVPSDLAYGESGAGEVIPPYSTLIFDVELLAILVPESEEGDFSADNE